MEIHHFVMLSNHIHLLLSPGNPRQLAAFMAFFEGNLAKEIGRLHDWEGAVWARRYQAIVVSEEESAQMERLLYLLRHGVKEHLVDRPQDWPGPHGVEALLEGSPLTGIWIDRSPGSRRQGRREALDSRAGESQEIVVLTPLPCWSHLSPVGYRSRIAELVRRVEEEARVLARECGPPLGRDRVLRQHPHQRPQKPKRSPAPLVHASTKAVRLTFVEAYRSFVSAFRRAADLLKRGDRLVRFPALAFPPPLPASG